MVLLLQDSSIAGLKISGTLPANNEESFFKALAVILVTWRDHQSSK